MSQKPKKRLSEKQQFREKNEIAPSVSTPSVRDWPTRNIPLADIFTLKQIRSEFVEIESLAENIRMHGLIHPITVIDTGETPKKYQLVTGERRFRAYHLLKYPEICARILPKNTSEKCILGIQLSENLQKSDMHLIEVADGIARMLNEATSSNEERFTQEEISSILNKPQARVSEYIRVARLSENVKSLLKKSQKIYLHDVVQIARLKSPEEQLRKAQSLLEKETRPKKKKNKTIDSPLQKFKSLKGGGYKIVSWKAKNLEDAISSLESLLKQLKQERLQKRTTKKN